MLTDKQLDLLIEPAVNLFRDYEDAVINDIARRLGNMSFDSAAWQVQRLSESGMLYNDILERLSLLTGKSDNFLRDIFRKAGVRSLKFDDSLYIMAGLSPMPLNLSPAMINVLATGLNKTKGVMHNFTMTTALSGQDAFIRASDIAYLEVSSGAMSYDQAIRQAVKDIASQGLSTVQFGRRTDFADVAMRRTLLTGVSQTTGTLTMARMDELNVDLVQTSAHSGSRPEHEPWQGKVFSRSGTSDKYPDFVTETGYGEVDGLMGINCRHTFFPFFEGISENAYSEEALAEDYNDQTVTLGGKEVGQYEASQIQRGIERKIREWKREAGALEAASLDNTAEIAKVREWQSQMRDFIKQTKLMRQRVREQI